MNPDPSRRASGRNVDLPGEFRHAIRALGRSPGFAITVVLTLALGLAATTTMFELVDHVLFRPLPYRDADRLVTLFQAGTSGARRLVSYPTLQDWARDDPQFAEMAWMRGTMHTLTAPAGPERVLAAYVSPGFFHLMGTAPALGRTFAAEEEMAGGAPVVVLSTELWKRLFNADSGVIGRTIDLDGSPVVVIGVMPEGFEYPWGGMWRPLAPAAAKEPVINRRDYHVDSRAIGRLAPGVSLDAARGALTIAQRRVAAAYPHEESDWTSAAVAPLRDEAVGNIRPALLALGGAVALLFLIVCVNVANLSAIRGASRSREVAIRTALGASRGDLARGLFIEYSMLAGAGGAIGIWLSVLAVGWLRATAPFDLLRAREIGLDGKTLAAAAVMSVLVAIVAGVVPALRAASERGAASGLLGARTGSTTRSHARVRSLLTASQFALALLLLIGTGLLIRSYERLVAVPLGFDSRGVLAITLSPDRLPKYAESQATLALYERILDQLRTVPGVEDAAIVNFVPLSEAGVPTALELPGRAVSADDQATYLTVSADYLNAMRIRLVAGRWFSPAEMRDPGDGIVVSESIAKRFWPGADPIGQKITIHRVSQARADFGRAVPSIVIGVVGDVLQFGPEWGPDKAVYVPLAAETWPWATVVVRARSSSGGMRAALGRAVAGVDAQVLAPGSPDALSGFEPIEGSLSSMLEPRRFVLAFVTAFSGCALLLAALGVYGVMSYAVAQRTHEMGIRMAIGATARDVLMVVLTRGIGLAVVGSLVGMAGALAFAKVLAAQLFETSPVDPVVFVLTPVLLITVGALASYLPARRAASVDPVIALRSE
jgi:putative ABC transport system permease protein